MITNSKVVLSLIIGIFSTNSFACNIITSTDTQALQFIFQETFENHTSGSQLPGELKVAKVRNERINLMQARSGDRSAAEYVRAEYSDDCECIRFYLRENKTLSDYRNEMWKPSLEYEFQLLCSNEGHIQTYTYMLGIIDENLYPPEFVSLHYEGELEYSMFSGIQIQFTNQNVILTKDLDFNSKHSDVKVKCNGNDCIFLEFVPKLLNNYDENGHYFEIMVKPTNEIHPKLKEGEKITVELFATDGLYESNKSAKIELNVFMKNPVPSSKTNNFVTYAISGGVVLVILLSCSGTVAYLSMRSRKAKNLLRKLTEAEIREFLEGNASLHVAEGKRSVDVNTPIMALPYNHAFEIQREKLRIDETTILGTGAFGIVWKGSVVYSNGETITVAVKTVKRNVGILYFKALLSELKIMAYIGKHPNIVSLVGACTHNIRKREVYIAVQYCANGNFHNYLKCRRDRFQNLVVDGKLQLTNSAAYSYMYSGKGCFSKFISTMDLLKWVTQIANGLQYLESLGVIHGDLATRNVLIDNDRVAKIGDFGLSRRLIDYSNYYYTKTSQAPLPWKWMAPESLKDMKFSKKSDIWSYGIVLWEVFTLGQTPYPGLNWDETFLERLEKGMRPTKPSFAFNLLYDIMLDCWNLDPHDRPAIFDVKRALENVTISALQQMDKSYIKFLEKNQPYSITLGEQEHSILKLMKEDELGYLEPNDSNRRNSNEA